MELNTFLPFALVILSSWLLLLSVLVYWKVLRGKNAPRLSGEEQIAKAVAELQEGQKSLIADLRHLNVEHQKLSTQSITFLQKLGFLRFNPFEETGGDQSFSVALLDGNNDGFVLTSLHTRSGTRTYAKEVKSGKNKQGFSSEEQKVIKLATGKNIEK